MVQLAKKPEWTMVWVLTFLIVTLAAGGILAGSALMRGIDVKAELENHPIVVVTPVETAPEPRAIDNRPHEIVMVFPRPRPYYGRSGFVGIWLPPAPSGREALVAAMG